MMLIWYQAVCNGSVRISKAIEERKMRDKDFTPGQISDIIIANIIFGVLNKIGSDKYSLLKHLSFYSDPSKNNQYTYSFNFTKNIG